MKTADCLWRVSTSLMVEQPRRFDQVEILLLGTPMLHTLILQRGYE
jgi:hypothetical protein